MSFALTAGDLTARVTEALDYIRANEPVEGYYVGFSGGKDSIVTHDLVKRSGVKYQSFYNMTLIDPPEVVRFIRRFYPAVIHLKPDFTFWSGILAKGLPLRTKRWCCDKLKHGTKASRGVALSQRIMGLRAEESVMRASRRGSTLRGKVFRTHRFMTRAMEDWVVVFVHL